MKKILLLAFLGFSAIAFGQKDHDKIISKMEEGTVLTKDDIGFINMVSGVKPSGATRDAKAKWSTKLKSKIYTEEQKLTKADAKFLQTQISKYVKANPGLTKEEKEKTIVNDSRQNLCWYWYWYCDWNGNCFWYKYYYRCF